MYINKKDVISSYEKASENGFLYTQEGDLPVFKGEYIATNLDGDQFVVTENFINDLIRVAEVKPQPSKKECPFTEQHMLNYMNACGLKQDESNDYIEGRSDGWILDNK